MADKNPISSDPRERELDAAVADDDSSLFDPKYLEGYPDDHQTFPDGPTIAELKAQIADARGGKSAA